MTRCVNFLFTNEAYLILMYRMQPLAGVRRRGAHVPKRAACGHWGRRHSHGGGAVPDALWSQGEPRALRPIPYICEALYPTLATPYTLRFLCSVCSPFRPAPYILRLRSPIPTLATPYTLPLHCSASSPFRPAPYVLRLLCSASKPFRAPGLDRALSLRLKTLGIVLFGLRAQENEA